jgi:hypothetical protein
VASDGRAGSGGIGALARFSEPGEGVEADLAAVGQIGGQGAVVVSAEAGEFGEELSQARMGLAGRPLSRRRLSWSRRWRGRRAILPVRVWRVVWLGPPGAGGGIVSLIVIVHYTITIILMGIVARMGKGPKHSIVTVNFHYIIFVFFGVEGAILGNVSVKAGAGFLQPLMNTD